ALVWSVCQRILRNPVDAEDAFQATFLVLARKAASIRPQAPVGNWLYGVAVRTASKAKTRRARQVIREKQLRPATTPSDKNQELWVNVMPVLDQELSALPDRYRACVVARYLQGKSTEDSARELGCPEGTLKSRLSRALELLRRRLARRGIEAT